MWLRSMLLIAVLALAAGVALWAQSAGSPQNPVEDLPPGPMQAKATTACMECHDARIILQQRLSKAAWTREVDKMVKWGALVDPTDRDALIDYLSANFGTDRPPYQAPRIAAAKTRSQTSKK
jgi:mono/diheme cytochrome c family protein